MNFMSLIILILIFFYKPRWPGESNVSLLLVICGTMRSEFGGVAETVDVCGDVASVKLGRDWPSEE